FGLPSPNGEGAGVRRCKRARYPLVKEYFPKKSIVTLAGYPIGNDTHNPVSLEQVTGLELSTSGMPGVSTVNVIWQRNKAAAYIVQTAARATYGPATVWSDVAFVTTSKCQLPLSAGTWSVRIVAISGVEQSEPSDPIAIVVG
ncbi:MAG: hypothetical protein SH857_17785, partial [Chitinophagales bacterium]|nr:hypothetical protein [Chitinophagales bacterium]